MSRVEATRTDRFKIAIPLLAVTGLIAGLARVNAISRTLSGSQVSFPRLSCSP